MTEEEILKFGEIQYLKGRLDELYKALPTVFNMERRRKLDQRIEKYINKLKKVDEVAFRLYEVELRATTRVKEKGKRETENLLNEILQSESITDENLIEKIKRLIQFFLKKYYSSLRILKTASLLLLTKMEKLRGVHFASMIKILHSIFLVVMTKPINITAQESHACGIQSYMQKN